MFDRNISIYIGPGYEIWKQVMSKLPFPFRDLAERIYITSSWDEFDNITKYHLLEEESFLYYVEPTITLYQNIIFIHIIGNTC